MCNLSDGDISGDALLKAQFVRHLNEANREVWSVIFHAFEGWQYDDSNFADLPQATINLVSGTRKYAIPSDALTMKRVEIYTSAGAVQTLKPTTLDQIKDLAPGVGVDDFMKSNGTPLYYRLLNGIIELFPAPSYSYTAGLKFYFDRDISEFVAGDTTKNPGFASIFHITLARRASVAYLTARLPDNKSLPVYIAQIKIDNDNIRRFYGKRFEDLKPKVAGKRNIMR